MNDAIAIGNLPRWAWMWLAAGAMFFAGKAAAAWPLRGKLGWKRVLAFTFLWVGMDARAFLVPAPGRAARAGDLRSLRAIGVIITAGAFLLWGTAGTLTHPLARGWCGMTGLILVLHFGLFAALAVFLRARNVPVAPIMNAPIAATSLAEFWGRRWNKAFRDLAHPLVFRPVARRHGNTAALWMSFAASGLAHEFVISFPAGAGYGLPTAYFLLQALGITIEKRLRRGAELPRRPAGGWLLTHAFTVLPAFFLFHPPFVERVMLPFFHVIGALP
jgi:hypothetical protein